MSPSNDTFKLSAALYKKYQMAIHGDTAEDCGVDNYREFLVDTPIQVLFYFSYIVLSPYLS